MIIQQSQHSFMCKTFESVNDVHPPRAAQSYYNSSNKLCSTRVVSGTPRRHPRPSGYTISRWLTRSCMLATPPCRHAVRKYRCLDIMIQIVVSSKIPVCTHSQYLKTNIILNRLSHPIPILSQRPGRDAGWLSF